MSRITAEDAGRVPPPANRAEHPFNFVAQQSVSFVQDNSFCIAMESQGYLET